MLPGCSNSPESSSTLLSVVEGEVQVMKAGSEDWNQGTSGMILDINDKIKCGANSRAIITFFDGSTIELKADTLLEIKELIKGTANVIRLKQQLGDTVSTVKKLTDPASRYEIETPTAIAGVRGSSMLVSVASDGTTIIQNLAGQISVTAQGIEVMIPVGSASTVQPGQPPSVPKPVSLGVPDSTDDLFDNRGEYVTGDKYQDILGASLTQDGDTWFLIINLNGEIPSSVEPTIFMEWNLMIDSDNDNSTGWDGTNLFNDIGADYYINFYVNGDRTSAGGFLTADTAGSHFTDIEYTVSGQTVEVRIPSKDIGNASNFNYLILTRKYDNSSGKSTLLGADKYPNQGHLTTGS